MRTTTFTALVGAAVAAVLVAGCAAGISGTALTGGSEPGTGGPTTGGPTTGDPRVPDYEHSAASVVIELHRSDYTVAGMIGSSSTSIHGDGRVVRTADNGVTTEELRIAQSGIDELLADATERGLLEPPDLDDYQISDSGSASLTLRVDGREISMEITGPGMADDGDSPSERARRAFGEFATRVRTLEGINVVEPATPVMPDRVSVSAEPVPPEDADSVDPIGRWPLDRPAPELFADSDVVILTGAKVRPLVERLIAQGPDLERRNGMAIITAPTGEPGLELLRLAIAVDEPGRQQRERSPDAADPQELPWPAGGRHRTTAWESWIADSAVRSAADEDRLPLGDPGYVYDYLFSYATGTVGGRTVIDVLATPDDEHAGREDIPPFAARVTPGSAGYPTVTKITRLPAR